MLVSRSVRFSSRSCNIYGFFRSTMAWHEKFQNIVLQLGLLLRHLLALIVFYMSLVEDLLRIMNVVQMDSKQGFQKSAIFIGYFLKAICLQLTWKLYKRVSPDIPIVNWWAAQKYPFHHPQFTDQPANWRTDYQRTNVNAFFRVTILRSKI